MYKDLSQENKNHISLNIYNFECSPEELTSILGLNPTETRIKGEYRIFGKGNFERKRLNEENAWILKSELDPSESLSNHLWALINKIHPHKEKFREVINKYQAELSCAPYYYEANPGIQFDKKLLKEISELGLTLDLDIYCLAGTISQFEQADADKQLANQLSQIKFVNMFSNNHHSEAEVLAKSLIAIDSVRNKLKMHLEDLVVWDDLNDNELSGKLNEVKSDLLVILKAIAYSKSLRPLLNEVAEQNNKNAKLG